MPPAFLHVLKLSLRPDETLKSCSTDLQKAGIKAGIFGKMNFSSCFILLLHQQDAIMPVAPAPAPVNSKGCSRLTAPLFFCLFPFPSGQFLILLRNVGAVSFAFLGA